MPLASRTPLGRQLRSVLANLCPPRRALPPSSRRFIGVRERCTSLEKRSWTPDKQRSFDEDVLRKFNVDASTCDDVAAAPTAAERKEAEIRDLSGYLEKNAPQQDSSHDENVVPGRRIAQTNTTSATTTNIFPRASNSSKGISSHSPGACNNKEEGGDALDSSKFYFATPRSNFTEEMASSPSHMAGIYTSHLELLTAATQANRMSSSAIEALAESTLDGTDGKLDDVRTWTRKDTLDDPGVAAKLISESTLTKGLGSVPAHILTEVLRKPFIGAHTVRILADQCFRHVDHRDSDGTPYWTLETAFTAFRRLMRHAREVWSEGFGFVTKFLLCYSQQLTPNDKPIPVQDLDRLTHVLNEALEIIAIPTAVNPLKDVGIQESAIISVLKFMSEHSPVLQMNRTGYRAVTAIQLAQKKTPQDRVWAELKALSWPPWKEERTAMDANITRYEYGASKAAQTLERMRKAGYAPGAWEKTASICSGWDIDETPTIQTRALIPFHGGQFLSEAAEWMSRITATRTVQEAWACYLAYEDKGLPQHQGVYLAIFKKLYKASTHLRDQARRKPDDSRRYPLYPGDTREIEPLPPSTHLHTYTRTTPPSMETFYRALSSSGVVFTGHCLAFLVANASSLQEGVEYLLQGTRGCQSIQGLITLDPRFDLSLIPMPIFAATIALLSRYAFVPSVKAKPFLDDLSRSKRLAPIKFSSDGHLNRHHTLAHAITLLAIRRPLFRPPWNSVLAALAGSAQNNIHRLFIDHKRTTLPREQEVPRSALIAYRAARRVLRLMNETLLDIDDVGMHRLCNCTENATIAAWELAQRGTHDRYSLDLLRTSAHCRHLKSAFDDFVGEHDASESTSSDPRTSQPPSFLVVPGPSLLHAYIRAIGWSADHDGLLATARWMAQHRAALAAKRAPDRNGEILMRRTLAGLRVFLERSWISHRPAEEETADEDEIVVDEAKRDEKDEKQSETNEGVEDVALNDVNGGGSEEYAGTERLRLLRRLRTAAPRAVREEVKELIERHAEDWGGGWPTDEEAAEYIDHSRFRDGLARREDDERI